MQFHDVGGPVSGDLLLGRVRRAQQGLPFLPCGQWLRAPRGRVRRAFHENVGKGSVGMSALSTGRGVRSRVNAGKEIGGGKGAGLKAAP